MNTGPREPGPRPGSAVELVCSTLGQAKAARWHLDYATERDPQDVTKRHEHVEAQAMRDALDRVIELLSPWDVVQRKARGL